MTLGKMQIQTHKNDYYERKYIQYLIIESAKYRDFSALNSENNANIRGLSVKCLYDLHRALKLINWEKNRQNIYRSVATLKNIPEFTFNPKKRSEETREWYRNKYDENIQFYDLFFDFDKPEDVSWNELIKEVKIFKQYLDEYNVSYSLIFSGKKGFQIVIDGRYLDIEKIEKGNVYPHKSIAENIKNMLSLEFLDLSNNGINSRLMKIPYSLVGDNIALPLSNEQLDNFKIEDMHKDNILSNIKLIRRGVLERNSLLDLNEKKQNLRKFIKLFDF